MLFASFFFAIIRISGGGLMALAQHASCVASSSSTLCKGKKCRAICIALGAPNILNVVVSVALMLQPKFFALFLDAVAVPRRVVSDTGMVQARQHPDTVTVDATTSLKEKGAHVIVMEARCTSPFAVFLCAVLP